LSEQVSGNLVFFQILNAECVTATINRRKTSAAWEDLFPAHSAAFLFIFSFASQQRHYNAQHQQNKHEGEDKKILSFFAAER